MTEPLFESPTLGAITEERLEELSGLELVALYNELRPEAPVKRFSDRKAGLRRVRAALEERAPAAEPSPGPEPSPAPPQPEERLCLPLEYPIHHHRPNTRRGRIIRLMQREEGASIEEMCEATGWSPRELRTTLKLINLHLGHGIEEDEHGRIHILGRPKDRKPFNLPPGPKIKNHRPGTKRAKVIELLQRPEGASMEEIQEATGWNPAQAFQGVSLINSYVGYGLREDDQGRIYIDNAQGGGE